MRNMFILLIAVLASSAALADGPTVAWKYVDDAGVVSYTDSEKRVPAMYKERAEKLTLGGLGDYERFTAVVVAPEAVAAATPVSTSPVVIVQTNSAPEQACGTIRVRSERREGASNSGGDNTRFYIAEDDCGVLFDAPYYPELNSLRR